MKALGVITVLVVAVALGCYAFVARRGGITQSLKTAARAVITSVLIIIAQGACLVPKSAFAMTAPPTLACPILDPVKIQVGDTIIEIPAQFEPNLFMKGRVLEQRSSSYEKEAALIRPDVVLRHWFCANSTLPIQADETAVNDLSRATGEKNMFTKATLDITFLASVPPKTSTASSSLFYGSDTVNCIGSSNKLCSVFGSLNKKTTVILRYFHDKIDDAKKYYGEVEKFILSTFRPQPTSGD